MNDMDEMGLRVDATDPVTAHTVKSPDQILMEAEEADEVDAFAALSDVFRLVLCFVFHDRRSLQDHGWDYAAAALEVLYREFVPSLWYGLGEDGSARRLGVGLVSGADGGLHELLRRADTDVLERVLERLAVGLSGKLWVLDLTRRYYSLGKILDEDLLGGVSLEGLGGIFGESNPKAARARWSERNKVVIQILAGGVKIRARYQKAEESCERMRAAQMGNQNRVKGENIKG